MVLNIYIWEHLVVLGDCRYLYWFAGGRHDVCVGHRRPVNDSRWTCPAARCRKGRCSGGWTVADCRRRSGQPFLDDRRCWWSLWRIAEPSGWHSCADCRRRVGSPSGHRPNRWATRRAISAVGHWPTVGSSFASSFLTIKTEKKKKKIKKKINLKKIKLKLILFYFIKLKLIKFNF